MISNARAECTFLKQNDFYCPARSIHLPDRAWLPDGPLLKCPWLGRQALFFSPSLEFQHLCDSGTCQSFLTVTRQRHDLPVPLSWH